MKQRPARILLDFGYVLTGPQDPSVFDPLLAELGLERAAFHSAWAAHRRGYDAGELSAAEYWALVLEAAGLAPSDAAARAASRREELVDLDLEAWLSPREAVHAWLRAFLDRGGELAILSNMPPGIGERYVAAWPWLRGIPHRLFSGDEGLMKPDQAFFRRFLERTGWEPAETLFVDDVAANVEAGARAGLATHLFAEEGAAIRAMEDWEARPR